MEKQKITVLPEGLDVLMQIVKPSEKEEKEEEKDSEE